MSDEAETPQQRIQKLDALMEQLQNDRAETVAKLSSGGAPAAVTERIAQEEKDAATWDRLSPGERMQLYQQNRAEWQRLLDAVEKVGLRKLMSPR